MKFFVILSAVSFLASSVAAAAVPADAPAIAARSGEAAVQMRDTSAVPRDVNSDGIPHVLEARRVSAAFPPSVTGRVLPRMLFLTPGFLGLHRCLHHPWLPLHLAGPCVRLQQRGRSLCLPLRLTVSEIEISRTKGGGAGTRWGGGLLRYGPLRVTFLRLFSRSLFLCLLVLFCCWRPGIFMESSELLGSFGVLSGVLWLEIGTSRITVLALFLKLQPSFQQT
jgi:hypothetical protein